MSIENDYLNDEYCKGSATDKHGNALSWQAHPDEGFMDISVNGEELISYCYESNPEPVFNEFVTVWEKAQKCMGSPAASNQDQIANLEATVRQLTNDRYRLLREVKALKGEWFGAVEKSGRLSADKPWFAYDTDNGFTYHATQQDALSAGADYISSCLDSDDSWAEEVTDVCVGMITHNSTIINERKRPDVLDEDGCDEEGTYWYPDWDYTCSYKLLPVVDQESQS